MSEFSQIVSKGVIDLARPAVRPFRLLKVRAVPLDPIIVSPGSFWGERAIILNG
jgi:hypothetical protein